MHGVHGNSGSKKGTKSISMKGKGKPYRQTKTTKSGPKKGNPHY